MGRRRRRRQARSAHHVDLSGAREQPTRGFPGRRRREAGDLRPASQWRRLPTGSAASSDCRGNVVSGQSGGWNRDMKKKVKNSASSDSPAKVSTLSIDIGGTGLKASVLDRTGKMLVDRARVATPYPCTPKILLQALADLI